MIAPSKTPQRPGPESKSDRLDWRKLVEYYAKGLLRAVAIPTEEQEADRQVGRLRGQRAKKVTRVKQQIKSFLLQYGIPEPLGSLLLVAFTGRPVVIPFTLQTDRVESQVVRLAVEITLDSRPGVMLVVPLNGNLQLPVEI
jgi:transposase